MFRGIRALSAIFIIACSFPVLAQDFRDALRYSTFEPIGSARSIGVNGTMGALGADFSSATGNPAGLAWYRKGEFSLSTGFLVANAQSTLLSGQDNATQRETKANLHLGNLGFVVASDPQGPDWRSLNFAFGVNRLQNYHQRFFYEGDSRGSIVDRFQELANSGNGLDNFESGLAYDAAAIYDLNDDQLYESDFELAPNALIRRKQTIEHAGAATEMTFSAGANFKDLLMIGASVGLPFLTQTEEKSYDEEDINSSIPFFDNLQYVESVTTSGIGINAKLGFILRPVQMLRLGAAIHTPTVFRLEDNYYSQFTYNYTESGQARTGDARSPDGSFNYRLLSPWRFLGQAAVVLGKMGFVSAEAEYVNFSNAQFRFRDFPADEEIANNGIGTQLSPVWNVRLGAEAVLEQFRFRAGAGIHPSPHSDADEVNLSFSGGVGLRSNNFFLDLGYRYAAVQQNYTPYVTAQAPQQEVSSKTGRSLAVLGVGFRF